MSDTQQMLEFNRRKLSLRKLQTGDSNVIHLLRVLDDHAADKGQCYLRQDTLASEMNCSESTVYRACRKAQELGLLIVFPKHTNENGWCNLYRLRWAEIHDRATDPRHAKSRRKRRRKKPTNLDVNLTSTTSQADVHSPSDRRAVDVNLTSYKKQVIKQEVKPPPPTPSIDQDRITWDQVVVEMLQFGIQETDRPVASARHRGCSAAFVMALIDHARSKPGAWGPAGLRRRIMNAFPGQPVEDGWLDESPEYRRKAAAAAERERLAGHLSQEAQHRERLNAEAEAHQRREARFGAVLDSMSTAELEDLAEAVFRSRQSPGWRLFQRRGMTPATRRDMLRELERRELSQEV